MKSYHGVALGFPVSAPSGLPNPRSAKTWEGGAPAELRWPLPARTDDWEYDAATAGGQTPRIGSKRRVTQSNTLNEVDTVRK
jgi:hypothetical protein